MSAATKPITTQTCNSEQAKRLERHRAKKETATDRLHQKFRSLGSDALLDEYEAAAYVGCSVQKLRMNRVRGGGLPFLKIGAAVRYRLGDIKAISAN
ncbi:MAG: hypothetical protein AB7U43_12835 [Desulfobacter sp.]